MIETMIQEHSDQSDLEDGDAFAEIPRTLMGQLRADGTPRLRMGTHQQFQELQLQLHAGKQLGDIHSMVFASIRRNASLARQHILAAFGGMGADVISERVLDTWVRGIAEEAIQNAARDGNRFDANAHVQLHYGMLPAKDVADMALLVQDEGSGFFLEEVPNCNHMDYMERSNGRGLMMMNTALKKLSGCGTYFPMEAGSDRTNILLIQLPLPVLHTEVRKRFHAWAKEHAQPVFLLQEEEEESEC